MVVPTSRRAQRHGRVPSQQRTYRLVGARLAGSRSGRSPDPLTGESPGGRNCIARFGTCPDIVRLRRFFGCVTRAYSSVRLERTPDKGEVAGSIPARPTQTAPSGVPFRVYAPDRAAAQGPGGAVSGEPAGADVDAGEAVSAEPTLLRSWLSEGHQ